jgi:hypothetical protein
VKGKKNKNQHVYDRLPVKAQCPVGFFVLCKKEKACHDFNTEEDDERSAAYSMEKPDKHTPPVKNLI